LIKNREKIWLQKLLKSFLKGPIYTWRTFIGIKLNNNWTQYFRPANFW